MTHNKHPKTDLHLYEQQICNKRAKASHEAKSLFNIVLEQVNIHVQNKNFDSQLTLHININSK